MPTTETHEMVPTQWGIGQMNIAQMARAIRWKIIAWWHDEEDTRLDALVAGSYETPPDIVAERGVTAHHLVAMAARASNSQEKLTGAF